MGKSTEKTSKKRARDDDGATESKKVKKSKKALPTANDDETVADKPAVDSLKKSKKSKKTEADPSGSSKKKSEKTKKSKSAATLEEAVAPTSALFTTTPSGLDSALSSLFAADHSAPINEALLSRAHARAAEKRKVNEKTTNGGDPELDEAPSDQDSDAAVPNDAELSPLPSDDEMSVDGDDDGDEPAGTRSSSDDEAEAETMTADSSNKKRRRKRDDQEDEQLEVRHLKKLATTAEKQLKKDAALAADSEHEALANGTRDVSDDDESMTSQPSDKDEAYVPPQHESLGAGDDSDFEKAARTVFLGNVSTSAIKSKSDRKILEAHLKSFFTSLPKSAEAAPAPALESLRFRSTPFASAIPKRAAFARKEVMDATAHSTNAYAVYSSKTLALQAVKHLNATIVLSRHLRVDSIAHPAPVDHKRCIFVGNLGFVDDESAMDAADPHQTRKTKKTPSDIEEGLWQTFSTVGTVESVRVVRDPATRVGKGFAYVQFTDENGVEAALAQLNEKKFPPMLPRKLRLDRAKAVKRNAAAKKGREANRGGNRASGSFAKGGSGYKVKLTPQQQSQMGRAAKLLGKAAAGQMKVGQRSTSNGNRPGLANGADAAKDGGVTRKMEDFVFEGQRAKSGTKTGIKMKKGPGKKAKPTKSSGKRAAAWKAKKKAPST